MSLDAVINPAQVVDLVVRDVSPVQEAFQVLDAFDVFWDQPSEIEVELCKIMCTCLSTRFSILVTSPMNGLKS